MDYEQFKIKVNQFEDNVSESIGSNDPNIFYTYASVLRSRELDDFFIQNGKHQIRPSIKKKWAEQYQTKLNTDKRLFNLIDSLKQDIKNHSKDYHNEYIRQYNKEYKEKSLEFEYFLSEPETEMTIGYRDAIHCFIEFCIEEWGLKFNPQVIQKLQEIDRKVVELVKLNKNGKVIFAEPKSYPNSHWWWHLNELDKLSEKDLETI